MACSPSIILLKNPKYKVFLKCIVVCSLSFFLFGFHVHEKQVLSIVIPVFIDQGPFILHLTNIAMFSLYPLIVKDNLELQYFCLLLFWNVWYPGKQSFLYWMSMVGCLFIQVGEIFYKSERYPDLWTVINAVYCFLHFTGFLIVYVNELIKEVGGKIQKRNKVE